MWDVGIAQQLLALCTEFIKVNCNLATIYRPCIFNIKLKTKKHAIFPIESDVQHTYSALKTGEKIKIFVWTPNIQPNAMYAQILNFTVSMQ